MAKYQLSPQQKAEKLERQRQRRAQGVVTESEKMAARERASAWYRDNKSRASDAKKARHKTPEGNAKYKIRTQRQAASPNAAAKRRERLCEYRTKPDAKEKISNVNRSYYQRKRLNQEYDAFLARLESGEASA